MVQLNGIIFSTQNLAGYRTRYRSCESMCLLIYKFPLCSDLLFQDDKQMVVVGVVGKSSHADCNKMAGFKILDFCPSLISSQPQDGKITFYFKESESILYVHFESTYDAYILKDLEMMQNDDSPMNFHAFNSSVRTKFAKVKKGRTLANEVQQVLSLSTFRYYCSPHKFAT